MITKLVGGFSILWGIFWAVKPAVLRDKLIFKTGHYLFWLMMGAFVYPLIHFFGKTVGVAGTAAFLGAFWALVKLMKTTLRETFNRVPLIAFRVIGFLNIVTGSALIWWPRP